MYLFSKHFLKNIYHELAIMLKAGYSGGAKLSLVTAPHGSHGQPLPAIPPQARKGKSGNFPADSVFWNIDFTLYPAPFQTFAPQNFQ